MPSLSRRDFLSLSASAALSGKLPEVSAPPPLRSPRYDQVSVSSPLHRAQQRNTLAVLLGLGEDSLLKPFRAMAGQPAPGFDLGGWYGYRPDYNYKKDDAGLAPGSTFGQWTSALARFAAGEQDHDLAAHVQQLHHLLGEAISPDFFDRHRFPAYVFDKLVCGLVDAHTLLHDPTALPTLQRVRAAALPRLPGHAVEREIVWRPGRDQSYTWDESYTLPENLYRVAAAGGGLSYRRMADAYLLDSFFEPLARGENVLGGKHGYSHVNALCSAMQAWLVGGSALHLQAAVNGFRMLEAQSYATGGWAPDELLAGSGVDRLYPSLTNTHNSFETPCGAFAHCKLTRYLLQSTRDGHYGDSMERILWNTALGARPLQGDGRSFYYADFSSTARRIDSVHRWPCCSGTLPQLAADHGINAYLLGPGGDSSVWINLYLASRLRWTSRGTHCELEQEDGYPAQDTVRMRLRTSRPAAFSLHLRIPEWSGPAQFSINGEPQTTSIQGGFAELRRHWRTGDVIELRLPMQLRLEALRTNGAAPHPEVASLLWGPWVLMALAPMPTLTPGQLLGARRIAPDEWLVEATSGPIRFRPFAALDAEIYSSHVRLT